MEELYIFEKTSPMKLIRDIISTIYFTFFLSLSISYAQQQLSPQAQISIMTCSPGPELYQSWGHNAILIDDPVYNIRRIYNYGTFDFDTPNFIFKFIRGRLPYQLSTESYDFFLRVYDYFDQHVDQQVLNLNPSQKQRVYELLSENLLPENKYYKYEQFYDNCATRILDIFKAGLGDSLELNYSHLEGQNLSFRDAVDLYIEKRPWEDFGIDLLLGAKIDRSMTPAQYNFLPDYLAMTIDNAKVYKDGSWQSFTEKKVRVHTASTERSIAPFWVYPIIAWFIVFLLIAGISWLDLQKKKASFILDIILWAIAGIAGILLVFMWVGTDHGETANNWNILWLLPTHIVIPFLLRKPRYAQLMRSYFTLTVGINLLLLASWFIIPQNLHPGIIPLILALSIRALLHIFLLQVKNAN